MLQSTVTVWVQDVHEYDIRLNVGKMEEGQASTKRICTSNLLESLCFYVSQQPIQIKVWL